MGERIKKMYNAAWLIYKEYLENRDIAKFTDNLVKLKQQYGCEPDVEGLVFWWSARVQGLHDEYLGGKSNAGN